MKQTKKYIAAFKSGAKSGVWAVNGDQALIVTPPKKKLTLSVQSAHFPKSMAFFKKK